MSTKHVALLRGINVGTAKRVAMADLRTLVAGLGYKDVHTLLNSGNIVFSAPPSVRGDAAARIEEAMARKLGLSARVTVLTAVELATVVAENPLGDVADDPSRLLVAVPKEQGHRARLEALLEEDRSPEILALGKYAAYIWCPAGILASKLPKLVERVFGDEVTMRNWSTVRKLHALTVAESSAD